MRKLLVAAAVLVPVGASFLLWQRHASRPENLRPGKFPEQIVFVRSKDDVVSAGAIFAPPKDSSKPVAVIWIHGWGVNFYSPTYVGIGRALAERGLTTITANTRMHDIGNVMKYSSGKRVRGGGYWGVASEEVRDLAAWVDFAEDRGFPKIVLIGHSAGWAAVRSYQAETQDRRVAGVVLASGAVRAPTGPDDPRLLAQAARLVSEGAGDDLLRIPNRSFPSFVSAATFLDTVHGPPEFKDFFGTQVAHPAVTRIRCPILAFFGTNGDVGTEADLKWLKSSVERQSTGPRRVDITMIQNADHMYTGQESQVAQIIAQWVETFLPKNLGKPDGPGTR
jgi:dienelactone hydrolase